MAIHIGTSGWHYKHWVGNFYPVGTRPEVYLQHYLKAFPTVEINNSFYRLPTSETLAAWRDGSPKRFQFAVKASRFITHNKKLKDSGASFNLFFDRIRVLGEKLGPILFQLPPNWKYNGARLEEFLTTLPPGPRYVFEFRNPTWIRDEAFALLKRFGAGFCIYDMAGDRTPILVIGKLAYIRFHGPETRYGGSYPDEVLAEWAHRFRAWSRRGTDVFCYFNNDLGGWAPRNARTMLDMLKAGGQPS